MDAGVEEMLKVYLVMFLAGIPLGVLSQATGGGGSDLSWLAPFGAAAPFAALALIQMNRAQSKLDKQEERHAVETREAEKAFRTELAHRDEEIRQLRQETTQRERELVLRFGNIIYDSALLYKEGNTAVEQLSRRAAGTTTQRADDQDEQLQQVLAKIEELTEAMNRAHRDDDQ